MSTPKIKGMVEEMLKPYLDDNGFELVDVEYVKEGSNYFCEYSWIRKAESTSMIAEASASS